MRNNVVTFVETTSIYKIQILITATSDSNYNNVQNN